MASSTSSSRRRRRLWLFAGAEFDEAGWSLRVNGQTAPLEAKPLEVLHELLLRAGEAVSKEELFDAVWPGVTVVEGSLATAISKLRRALGEGREEVIETVPRIGYRLAAAVTIKHVEAPLAPRFAFTSGDPVPRRPQWRLDRALGETGAADVWLARHEKTGEPRVFKFADAPDRLRSLKREAALSRLVFAGLGKSAPLPALLEWNFDASPFFLEYAYGGQDLLAWSREAGGLAAVPLEERLALAARICRAVADVHALGVLHKDLKPDKSLVQDSETGPQVLLADFGSGRLLDQALLDSYRISDPGSLEADLDGDRERSGAAAYRAPELTGEALPTVKSDIYALGLILHQLAAGDFGKTLAPGWEADIADPLLKQDIREAAAGSPDERPSSAEELAARLETLEERRRMATQEAQQAAFLAEQQRLEERRRMRRPWVRAAAASAALGLIVTSTAALYAWDQRNRAVAARALADTGYSFLAEDIRASPAPALSSAEETVLDAIKRASRNIDTRFAASPRVAARLHLAVARAFHGRSDFETARAEYARADELFAAAGETDHDEAVIGRLGRIQMEAVSGQPDRLQEAGALLDQERERLGDRAESGRVGFALAQAEGAYGYMTDLDLAEGAFRRAAAIAAIDGSGVADTQRLKVESSLALTLMRLGRPQDAEPLARNIVSESERVRGAEHADTLVTRQHWLNSLSMLGRHEEAIALSTPLLSAMRERFGASHRFTLALHSTRFESYAALGDYSAATREAERVWRGASGQAGPDSHQALVGQIDYASALCRTPRRHDALNTAMDALNRSERAFGTDYPLTHAIRFYAGECQLAAGDHRSAAALLSRADRASIAALTGQTDIGGMIDLSLAEAAIARNDRPGAIRLLTAAEDALGPAPAAPVAARLRAARQSVERM